MNNTQQGFQSKYWKKEKDDQFSHDSSQIWITCAGWNIYSTVTPLKSVLHVLVEICQSLNVSLLRITRVRAVPSASINKAISYAVNKSDSSLLSRWRTQQRHKNLICPDSSFFTRNFFPDEARGSTSCDMPKKRLNIYRDLSKST